MQPDQVLQWWQHLRSQLGSALADHGAAQRQPGETLSFSSSIDRDQGLGSRKEGNRVRYYHSFTAVVGA